MNREITGTADEVFTELNILEDDYEEIIFLYALKENDNEYTVFVELRCKRK